MADEYANTFMQLLYEWNQTLPPSLDIEIQDEQVSPFYPSRTYVEKRPVLKFKQVLEKCKELLTTGSKTGPLIWDTLSLPWDGAIRVNNHIEDLLKNVKNDFKIIESSVPVLNILNTTDRKLSLQEIPLHFPNYVTIHVYKNTDFKQKFDVIVTDTVVTPDDSIIPFLQSHLEPHGNLICFGTLRQDIEDTLLKNKYQFYREGENESPFLLIKKIDSGPVLYEIIKSCIIFIKKCIKYLKRIDSPESAKIVVKWKLTLEKLEMGATEWNVSEFAAADTVWRVKFLCWSVYEIFTNLLSFFTPPAKFFMKFVGKLLKLLLKVYIALFHLLLYWGILTVSFFVGFFTLTFTGGLGAIFLYFLPNFRNWSLFLLKKTMSTNYFTFVKNLLKQYKENQIHIWMVLGTILPVSFVSYFGSSWAGGLIMDLAEGFSVMFYDVANQAQMLLKDHIDLEYWVFTIIPVTWLEQFINTYLLTPFKRILYTIADSALYQSITGTLYFLSWMKLKYNAIYIGPNRHYPLQSLTKFYYVALIGNRLSVREQTSESNILIMNNYFPDRHSADIILRKLKKDWNYFPSNNLKFLKGRCFYLLIDAVNFMLNTLVKPKIEDPITINSVNHSGVRNKQTHYNALIEKFGENVTQSSINDDTKQKILELLKDPNIDKTRDQISQYLQSTLPQLADAATQNLKYEVSFFKEIAEIHRKIDYFQYISNKLGTEIIILGKTLLFSASAMTSSGTYIRGKSITYPVITPTRVLNKYNPPMYIYQNTDGSFCPLFNLNLVVAQ
jgi:hypothetical protein